MNAGSKRHTETPGTGDTEAAILCLAREAPELGQAAVAVRLRQASMQSSPSGVRYIWQKHGLETTVKRLQALVQKSAVDEDARAGKIDEVFRSGHRSCPAEEGEAGIRSR